MDLPSAGQLAETLMRQHGLTAAGWTFRFNRRKRALGLCNYTSRRVELSAPFVARNPEPEIRDVLLHEIAHALTPPPAESSSPGPNAPPRSGAPKRRAGFSPHATPQQTPPQPYQPHGPAWRAMCLQIGANPDRLNTTANPPPGKYQAVCPGCQTTHHRHRKPAKGRSYICRACGPIQGKLSFTLITYFIESK